MRCRLVITGRVQGVWYRASLRDEALRRGVSGWVKNLPDGSVEAVLAGRSADVDALVGWCRTGPPGAFVEGVSVSHEEGGDRVGGFEIRY